MSNIWGFPYCFYWQQRENKTLKFLFIFFHLALGYPKLIYLFVYALKFSSYQIVVEGK